jgi:putative NADH-flavin reductase
MPYDITIRKVALVGATGNLGAVILEELLKSGLFEVTVLTRSISTHTFPPNVKVAKIDFSHLDSLTTALIGQDALVSTLASLAVASQRLLIDAAVAAGVKRILPSEFGNNLKNAKVRDLPVYAQKIKIEEYLDQLAREGKVSYTLVFSGPFLDWGLKNGMYLDFPSRKIRRFDGGDTLFSTSRLTTVGKAVRRILTHPRETADRAVYVKDIDVSQNQLLKLAQALTPGEEWEIEDVKSEDVEKKSRGEIERKEIGKDTMRGLLARAIWGEGYGARFEKVHNEVLGIKGMTQPDLDELVASLFGTGNL